MWKKGRGAQINTPNQFASHNVEMDDDFPPGKIKTQFFEEHAKKVINKTSSEDLKGFHFINPYQGCEHGCIYCFARNSHEYWEFSAGTDFESKIMVKTNVADVVEKTFQSKSWKPTPLHISGNTDCYQPAERKYQLTRSILQTCLKYRNPVHILTKNSLVLRDLDLIKSLAELNLVSVGMSITTLNETLRLALEPRTATGQKRIETLQKLSDAGIPTFLMTAPIIPGLNDHEIPTIIKKAADAGVRGASYTVVRLNGALAEIFTDWIQKHFPDKAQKVLKLIADCHGGKLNDSRIGIRQKGEGKFAENIKQLHELAVRKFLKDRQVPELDTSKFIRNGQLNLFN